LPRDRPPVPASGLDPHRYRRDRRGRVPELRPGLRPPRRRGGPHRRYRQPARHLAHRRL